MKTRWSRLLAGALAAGFVLTLSVPGAIQAQTPPNPPTPKPKGAPPGLHPQGPAPQFVAGEVLVKFRPGTRGEEIAAAHRQNGGQEADVLPGIDVRIIRVPPGQEVSRVQSYARNPNVQYAEVNGFYNATLGTNDAYVSQQWQYNNSVLKPDGTDADIDAFEAWASPAIAGKAGVPIAILDTGIDQDHPDLQSQIVWNRNLTRSRTVDDRYGHGTHVAGSSAAATNNSTGVAGTCPQCTLYNVKVLGDDGAGQWDWIAKGIVESVDQGAKVVNMSLSGSYDSKTVSDAVLYAWGKGVILVAAAGNNNSGAAEYPAFYDGVIAVAATDRTDQRGSFSNWGWGVDVAAPGADILSTAPNHRTSLWNRGPSYASLNGTSMAAPHVAGIAGLVWATGHCAQNANQCVRDRVELKSEEIAGTRYHDDPNLDDPNYPNNLWSWGRVNALNSVIP